MVVACATGPCVAVWYEYLSARLEVVMSVVQLLTDNDENPYCIGEDFSSDEEDGGGESSENELQDLLEKECSEESDDHMELTAGTSTRADSTNTEAQMVPFVSDGKTKETKTTGSPTQGSCSATKDCYSEDYFSSGSDDDNQVGGVSSKSQVRRKLRSDDDLFYDPHLDAEDESWVSEQRRSHGNRGKAIVQEVSETNASSKQQQQGSTNKRPKKPAQKAPQSDAILSCPACLSTLCIDCQRHEIYHNQYRAMFVMNCCVTQDEVLKYDEPKHRHLGKSVKKQKTGKLVAAPTLQISDSSMESPSGGPLETYFPVKCAECSTEVAVYDEEEVYHFFNVLTSHA